MSSRNKIIYTTLISFGIIIISSFMIWLYRLAKPTPGGCKGSNWKWDDKCNYIQELQYDGSLQSPNNIKPYLIKFSYVSGSGNSIFSGVWYRIRYVNVVTGGYSDFSDWTEHPVMSGSCVLPCDPKIGCSYPSGPDSCTFNTPVIGINTKDSSYSPQKPLKDGSFVYINLHRAISDTKPTENAETQIIGTLISPVSQGGEKYWTLIDVLNNPCKEGCNTPSICTGGSCP